MARQATILDDRERGEPFVHSDGVTVSRGTVKKKRRRSSVLEKALERQVFIHADGVTTSRGTLSDREILRNQDLKDIFKEFKPRSKAHPRNQFIDKAVKDAGG